MIIYSRVMYRDARLLRILPAAAAPRALLHIGALCARVCTPRIMQMRIQEITNDRCRINRKLPCAIERRKAESAKRRISTRAARAVQLARFIFIGNDLPVSAGRSKSEGKMYDYVLSRK